MTPFEASSRRVRRTKRAHLKTGVSTLFTFYNLVCMRRKEGLLLSARWAASLLWNSRRTVYRRSHLKCWPKEIA